jgi:hypothetical protein
MSAPSGDPTPPKDQISDFEGLDEAALARLLSENEAKAIFASLMERKPPVDLTAAIAFHHRRRAYLIDETELHCRAAAYLAFDAENLKIEDSLAKWVYSEFDLAIDALLEEDEKQEREKIAIEVPLAPRYELLNSVLGIPREYLRRACIVLNDQNNIERLAFVELVLLQGNTNRFCRRERVHPHDVRMGLRRALKAITHLRYFDRPLGG